MLEGCDDDSVLDLVQGARMLLSVSQRNGCFQHPLIILETSSPFL